MCTIFSKTSSNQLEKEKNSYKVDQNYRNIVTFFLAKRAQLHSSGLLKIKLIRHVLIFCSSLFKQCSEKLNKNIITRMVTVFHTFHKIVFLK